MSIELPIASSDRTTRTMLRIAIPAWGGRRTDSPEPDEIEPSREDYQRMLNGVLDPGDLAVLRLTKAERRQLSISRRVRDALYGSVTPV